jgi:hypothetical protein
MRGGPRRGGGVYRPGRELGVTVLTVTGAGTC